MFDYLNYSLIAKQMFDILSLSYALYTLFFA